MARLRFGISEHGKIMHKDLKNLIGKKIAILGLGIDNFALVKYLLNEKINCVITICDAQSEEDLGPKFEFLKNKKNIAWRLGANTDRNFDGFDVLFRSPGWPMFDPEISKAARMGVRIDSAIRLFLKICPSRRIIGVTGTKGKGTTAALINEILHWAGKKTWLGGNIGVAPFNFIYRVRKTDWVVLELSSFQLEDMDLSPPIAVITNFSREHISPADPHNPNYHRNVFEYWAAKLNIIKWQKRKDFAVINYKLKNKLKKETRRFKFGAGRKIYFTKVDLTTKMIGRHNQENIAAALAVAKLAGIDLEIAKQAAASFKGLEHRLESVAMIDEVRYFNDSFATTPESAITALRSFREPIILLAGGADKGADFHYLAEITKRKARFIILFRGKATPRLKRSLLAAGITRSRIRQVDSMKSAVILAKKKALPGDVVLLSPACASFGLFKNYKERGQQFKEYVKK